MLVNNPARESKDSLTYLFCTLKMVSTSCVKLVAMNFYVAKQFIGGAIVQTARYTCPLLRIDEAKCRGAMEVRVKL